MTTPQVKERNLNIVLIGDFNPHIFQPEWFVVQKLLGEKEGASAKVEVIHSDVAVFSLDWLRFEVTRDRLVVTTKDDQYHEIMKDLIIGTFSVLSHTPLKMIGINYTTDFMINDEKAWHGIGDRLAPKDIWNKLIDGPGLSSLVIQSKIVLKENYKNLVRITVSPAGEMLSLRIHINDHYELLETKDKFLGSSKIITILKDEWKNSQKKAVEIQDKIFKELL